MMKDTESLSSENPPVGIKVEGEECSGVQVARMFLAGETECARDLIQTICNELQVYWR